MSNQTFKFYNKVDEYQYCPKKEINSFYQICQFKNPYTDKYCIRKVIFNEHGEILKTFEKEYYKCIVDKFMKKNKQNKFSVYPVSDIKYVDLPDPASILGAKSELLNNTFTEYDFAAF